MKTLSAFVLTFASFCCLAAPGMANTGPKMDILGEDRGLTIPLAGGGVLPSEQPVFREPGQLCC